MSHYYSLVIIPAEGDLDELIAEALAPFNEELEVEQRTETYDGVTETYWHNPLGVWDWYQIGGRWTGVLSNYKPHEDPALQETCWLCRGTGKRDDELGRAARLADPGYGCNGCAGKGHSLAWPTSWPRHDGDVQDALAITARVAELEPNQLPYSIFVHSSEVPFYTKERWDGSTFVQELDDEGMRNVLATNLHARMKAGLSDRVVVVDYHS